MVSCLHETTSFLHAQLLTALRIDEIDLHTQCLIVSIGSPLDDRDSSSTFWTPYVPELNPYYRHETHLGLHGVRVEVNGLGIVVPATESDVTIRALDRQKLVMKLFEAFGMKADASEPGLIGARLIQQMGGIQGCRVFKIAGVRKLIQQYGPLESFTKSNALLTIGQVDPLSHMLNFKNYEQLYVEGQPITPEKAFIYLLKRGVFRVGLALHCPSCELEFWIGLDNVKTESKCEYCGQMFNIAPQLKDRDWRYRRSGLFGREDHQEGSIPVALTLLQLDTVISMKRKVLVTAMNIAPISANIECCESDFVVVTQAPRDNRIQIVIGECTTGGPKNEITKDDVRKLTKIADAFPLNRVEPFILFSKTNPFTMEEVSICQEAKAPNRFRVILLSDRELEPYFVYERTSQDFNINRFANSLNDLAEATHHIYFDPKAKQDAHPASPRSL